MVADVQESAYKKFFWVLMAAMVTWTGLGAYALISVTKDVQYISQSLHQLDSSVNARLAALEVDNKTLMYWKGVLEGRANGR